MGQDIRALFSSAAAKRAALGTLTKPTDPKVAHDDPASGRDIDRAVSVDQAGTQHAQGSQAPAQPLKQAQQAGRGGPEAGGGGSAAEPMVIDLIDEEESAGAGQQQQQEQQQQERREEGQQQQQQQQQGEGAAALEAPQQQEREQQRPGGAEAPPPAADGGAAAPAAKSGKAGKAAAEAPPLLTADEKAALKAQCEEEIPLLEQALGAAPDLGAAAADALAAAGAKGGRLDLKHEVALLVEGRSEGLSALAASIADHLNARGGGAAAPPGAGGADGGAGAAAAAAAVTPLVVRNLIQELASRKSYGIKDATLANVDAAEDAGAEHCWCWEVRDVRSLPKQARALAEPHRRHRKALHDRLRGAAALAEAAAVRGGAKAVEAKVARVAAKLRKLPALPALSEQLRAALGAAAAGKGAASGGKRQPKAAAAAAAPASPAPPAAAAAAAGGEPMEVDEAGAAGAATQAPAAAPTQPSEAASPAPQQPVSQPATVDKSAVKSAAKSAAKEAERARREAEREEERLRKEEEKARKEAEREEEKARKEAEREEERKRKEAEREEERKKKEDDKARKREEKAKQVEAKELGKQGFRSHKQLEASRNKLKSFFAVATPPSGMRPGSKSATSAGATGSGAPGAPGGSPGACSGGGGGGAGGSPGGGGVNLFGATPYSRRTRQMLQVIDEDVAALFAARGGGDEGQSRGAGGGGGQAGGARREEVLAAWREQRGSFGRVVKGLPPPYARRPGTGPASFDLQAAVEAVYGEGADAGSVRLWRRKLVRHWDSERPPYYGSWGRPAGVVAGRRPLGRAPELDYDVMSDEDWEEEPEGESLSEDADDASEAQTEGDETEGEEGAFVVKDGYLSEDEGCGGAEGGAEGGAGPMQTDRPAAAPAGGPASPRAAALFGAMERARRANRPLLLCSLASVDCQPTAGIDPAVLSCMRGCLLRTDILPLQPPRDPWAPPPAPPPEPAAAAGAAAAAAAGAGAAGAGGAASGGGGRGPRAAVFPEDLVPALVAHVQAAPGALPAVAAAFAAAHPGRGLVKASVERMVRQITLPRGPGARALVVRPEFLDPEAAAGVAAAAAAAAAAGGGSAPATPAAAPAPGAGGAGGSPQAAGAAAAAPAGGGADVDGGAGTGAGAAAAEPAAKRQKTATPGGGIQRFFKKPPGGGGGVGGGGGGGASGGGGGAASKDSPAPAAAAGGSPSGQQQQQQPEGGGGAPSGGAPSSRPDFEQAPAAGATAPAGAGTGGPRKGPAQPLQGQQQQQQPRLDLSDQPSTPKGARRVPALGEGAGTGAKGSAVLPLLTPPSHDNDGGGFASAGGAGGAPAGRPAKPRSPIPFRMGAADGGEDSPAAGGGGGRGRLLGGSGGGGVRKRAHSPDGAASPAPRPAPGRAAAPSGSPPAGPGGVPEAQPPSMFGWRRSPEGQKEWRSPQVPRVGGGAAELTAGHPFWRQLAHWVVNVKRPSRADIEVAFAVFGEASLPACAAAVPRPLSSAMVKTLGAAGQAPGMRAACARCLSALVVALSRALDAGAPPQQQDQQEPGQAQGAAAAAALAELCREPHLLANLYACLKAGNDLAAGLPPPPAAAPAPPSPGPAADALAAGGGGGEGGVGKEEALELAEAAAKCIAALVTLGVHNPSTSCDAPEPPLDDDAPPEGGAAAGAAGGSDGLWAALAALRGAMAADKRWRGVLKASFKPPPAAAPQVFARPAAKKRREAGGGAAGGDGAAAARRRRAYALMAIHGLLGPPAAGLADGGAAWRGRGGAARRLVPNELIARGMLSDVLAAADPARGANTGIRKWALAVAVDLLELPQASPWLLPRRPPGPRDGGEEALARAFEAGGALAAWALDRDATPGTPGACLQALGLRMAAALCGAAGRYKRARAGAPERLAAALEGGGGGEEGGPSLVSVLQRHADECCDEELRRGCGQALDAYGPLLAGGGGGGGAE
ncbi:MAG: hypothetical protein J3K34DRAFT_519599 [Monoraphidium minutum]|nr:MAG: hypothetical protein J3K34DRAFT_519599 [Monoraphidium minutum]